MIQCSNHGRGKTFFSSAHHPDWLQGPPSPLLSLYQGSFPEVKQSLSDVEHLPPTNVKVENKHSNTCASPVCLQSVDRANLPKYFIRTSQTRVQINDESVFLVLGTLGIDITGIVSRFCTGVEYTAKVDKNLKDFGWIFTSVGKVSSLINNALK